MIIKGPGYVPTTDRAVVNSPDFASTVLFVSSVEEAQGACQECVANGVQLIELCGGFSEADRLALSASIQHVIPIGVVGYSSDDDDRLHVLFGN